MRLPTVLLTLVGITALSVVALIGWSSWRASDAALPPLAQGMPAKFADGDRVFKARVASLYPVGSPEARLVSDLEAQGFEITRRQGRDYSDAALRRFIGCGDKVWSVRWHSAEGRLTKVWAVYGAICL